MIGPLGPSLSSLSQAIVPFLETHQSSLGVHPSPFNAFLGGLYHLFQPIMCRPVGVAGYETGPRRALGKGVVSTLDDVVATYEATRGTSLAMNADDRVLAVDEVLGGCCDRLKCGVLSGQGGAPSFRIELTAEWNGGVLASGHGQLAGILGVCDEAVSRLLVLDPSRFLVATPAPVLPALALQFSQGCCQYLRLLLKDQLYRRSHIEEEWYALVASVLGLFNVMYNCMDVPPTSRRLFGVTSRLGDVVGMVCYTFF
jgi:hypothetical protein